ncbi:MAG: response regulator [Pedosphaera sp.]|nr:response regulator [Pedosphaera sp.]
MLDLVLSGDERLLIMLGKCFLKALDGSVARRDSSLQSIPKNVIVPRGVSCAMSNTNSRSDGSPQQGRVLIIDDDPRVSLAFRRILERRGHEVFTSADGRDGLTKAQEESPELILLDLNLPVMGGLEALGHLSRLCHDVPVIIVSGSGTMSDAIQALKAGATDYLIKPLPASSALVHAVESNLQRSRLVRQNKRIRQELDLYDAQIREDEEAGRKVQARLFPQPDWNVGQYRFRHRVIPSLFLSGDFVDYFAVNAQFAVFYCADISGHGVSSALVTVLLKGLITKYRERDQDRHDRLILQPERVLAQLNRDILQEKLGKHLTVFYGVIDLSAHTLCHASGGHYPPPLLFSQRVLQTLALGFSLSEIRLSGCKTYNFISSFWD